MMDMEFIGIPELIKRFVGVFDPDTIKAIKGGSSLYGGLIIGLLFGIVLQKSRLCKYDIVTGLFRLQDFTVFRIGTPILMVSMVLVYFLTDMKYIELHVPKTVIIPQIIGGLLFGAAIAIMGYCPGTAAGAIGEGALDGIPAILGIISGSVIYAEYFHDDLAETFLTWGTVGRGTFPDIFEINHWYLIVLFLLMATMFLIMTTMVDWMIIFLRRTFNMFQDLTVTLEEKLPTESKKGNTKNNNLKKTKYDKNAEVTPYKKKENAAKKLKKNLFDIFHNSD
ncbi:MAG: YeeE/YedE family protein [Nitrospirae bacterium]|nr:YeeE/YedE family protein [Nitrospirota bacterium]MBF0590976.1 YeeE/YedE family protein [Nitrospirota bacterium]